MRKDKHFLDARQNRIYTKAMLRLLFIGGTGNISASVSRLCIQKGFELTLINRGKSGSIAGAESIVCDINDRAAVEQAVAGRHFDAVVNWVAFTPAEIERDIELFRGRTGQYVFISSASVYQKPPANCIVTESTPLVNPYWEYARDKIQCEQRLMRAFTEEQFPVTIVRPSHTYDTVIPLAIGGWREYTAVQRIKKGQPVISHGDGTSLWVLTHSRDFAKGFTGLLGNPRALGNAFHITSDEVLTWDQIYAAIGDAVGRTPNIVHVPTDVLIHEDEYLEGTLLGDKTWSVIFDNTKIKRLVPSFVCEIPFNVGIRETLAWFEARPERMVISERTNSLIQRICSRMERLHVD